MMWNDEEIALDNFYRLSAPDSKHMKQRMKRVAEIIAEMGERYCLAKPVEKKTNG